MQMVMRTLLVIIVALLALVLFAPKKELYYLLEQRLAKADIVLTDERIRETPLGLEIEHPTILFKGAEVAQIERVELTVALLRNTLRIHKLHAAPGMERIIPVSITVATALYSPIRPRSIELSLRGSFGEARGSYDLARRLLHLEIVKEGDLDPLRPYLKKKNGRWIYEKRF